MNEENKQSRTIRLNVYDTVIQARIPVEEEESYREAAKLVTDRVNAYMNNYKNKRSMKEIQYMAMIEIALNLGHLKQSNDTEPYDNILKKITEEIETALEGGR